MMKFIIYLSILFTCKDPNEAKRIDLEGHEDPKTFIEYSSNIMEILRNIEKCNQIYQ